MPTRRVLDQVRSQLRPLAVVFNRRRDEFRDRAPALHELSAAGAAPHWRQSPDGSRLATLLLATLAACTVAFSTLAAGVAGGELVSIDRTVGAWLHTHATGIVTVLLSTVTALGGTQVLLAVTLAAMLSLLLRRRVAHAALMGVALAGGQALNWALKAAFERPRPSFSDPLATATGFSFPSGHAMVSLIVYGALAFVTVASVGSRRAQLLAPISAIGLVLAIGFSRIYLGVHYASDVLAAYSAGLAWLTLCTLTLLGASRLPIRKPRSRALPIGSRLTAWLGRGVTRSGARLMVGRSVLRTSDTNAPTRGSGLARRGSPGVGAGSQLALAADVSTGPTEPVRGRAPRRH
jgi:membrane-associated phospholipid phosphatase